MQNQSKNTPVQNVIILGLYSRQAHYNLDSTRLKHYNHTDTVSVTPHLNDATHSLPVYPP